MAEQEQFKKLIRECKWRSNEKGLKNGEMRRVKENWERTKRKKTKRENIMKRGKEK